ncbi:MAG TPA: glycosyltransferase [Candidatus Limnocylindrales bacterium]|nr:glycosyltransferase [Candidatus Limnocylindrales bacterium]
MTRIAYLSYSTAEYDGRTLRMARSAIEAGYDVVVYARWQKGLPFEEQAAGYRIVRVPAIPELAIPGRRGNARRRVASARRRQAALEAAADVAAERATGRSSHPPGPIAAATSPGRDGWVPDRLRGTPVGRPLRAIKGVVHGVRKAVADPLLLFPLRPMGWAAALDDVAEPADIWHGMWAGSLPALERLRRRLGGHTVYDSRDVYMRSRGFERMGPWKAPFAALERRWATSADAVLTVNDAYADLLADQFDIERPPVVRNTPERYTRPDPPPDRIRQALALGADTRIVLYQGGLLTERGIEQGMDAILEVPDAVLALMGMGSSRDALRERGSSARYRDKVRFLDPVTPDELLDWTASSDVMLMAIQPTSVNHRYTTPQKLWEALAAGVPVVASDLPGMADVVNEVGAGALVDPTDPHDIARGIRAILDAPAAERLAMRERTWRSGQDRYNWESQVDTLFALYRRLLGDAQG